MTEIKPRDWHTPENFLNALTGFAGQFGYVIQPSFSADDSGIEVGLSAVSIAGGHDFDFIWNGERYELCEGRPEAEEISVVVPMAECEYATDHCQGFDCKTCEIKDGDGAVIQS